MTVRENLLFAVPAGPRAQRETLVKQALDDLELPGFAHADPATLSGGQRARGADDSVSKAKASGKGDSNPPVR